MGRRETITAGLLTGVLVLVAVPGCGGGNAGGTGSRSSDTTSSSSKVTKPENETQNAAKDEPSTEFQGSGPNAELVKFGEEANTAERETVSSVVEDNLQARAAGDWESQCATLATPIVKGIEKTAKALGAGAGCTKALEAQAKPAPASARANPMIEPVAALRIEGPRGFALFHGVKGKDYAMPVLMEGGEWKVASLVTEEVP
jgi:hypothetical protein